MERVEALDEHRVAGGLDLGAPLRVGLVGLHHRRLPVWDRLPADLDLQRCLQIRQPGLELARLRPEIAVERELMEVAQSNLLLSAGGASRGANALYRIAGEQSL